MENKYERFKMRKSEQILSKDSNKENNTNGTVKIECTLETNTNVKAKDKKKSVRNSILKAIFVKF